MGIKNLFFVEEEPKKDSPSVNVVVNENINKETFTTSPSATNAVVDCASDAMVSQLWDVVINKNLPGPDYLELRSNASALEGLPLSEEQKLEAAFKVLKTTYPSLTKEVILKSIATYIDIVNEERNSGVEQCNTLRSTKVGEMETRVKQLKESASETLKQIEELKKRYEDTLTSVNKMEHDILTTTQELDAKERSFTASVETVLATLNNDKSKITTLNI